MKDDILINQGEIGPFPGRVKPVRRGMYKRVTAKGNVVWSWFDGPVTNQGKYESGHGWCKFSGSYAKAKRHGMQQKRSKHQNLRWIGRVK